MICYIIKSDQHDWYADQCKLREANASWCKSREANASWYKSREANAS